MKWATKAHNEDDQFTRAKFWTDICWRGRELEFLEGQPGRYGNRGSLTVTKALPVWLEQGCHSCKSHQPLALIGQQTPRFQDRGKGEQDRIISGAILLEYSRQRVLSEKLASPFRHRDSNIHRGHIRHDRPFKTYS